MQVRYYHFAIILCLFGLSCSSSKKTSATADVLQASALQPFGRFDMIGDKLELISSAANFGFSFEGTECKVFASVPGGHNYLQYEIDGVYQKRLKIEAGSTAPIVLAASEGGKHTVWIYKATEAHTGPIFIQSVSAKSIKSLLRPTAPMIEFIGNSITCGAAADPSEVPCGQGVYHDQHNAYQAYGPRVARTLRVNYMLSSVSGIGIYRNWNSDGPTMPQVYEKTDFQANSTRLWDFGKYNPKVVSIALGTNDFSRGDGKKARLPFDSAAFVNAYIKFVTVVKAKYPAAQIALLSSAMVNGDNRTLLQNCLAAVKQNVDAAYSSSKPVAVYFFKPMQARGCGGHPNVEDHAILAEELAPFFEGLLKG